jgi:hypothetical protein
MALNNQNRQNNVNPLDVDNPEVNINRAQNNNNHQVIQRNQNPENNRNNLNAPENNNAQQPNDNQNQQNGQGNPHPAQIRRGRAAKYDPGVLLRLYPRRMPYDRQSCTDLPNASIGSYIPEAAYAHNDQANVQTIANTLYQRIAAQTYYATNQAVGATAVAQQQRVYMPATQFQVAVGTNEGQRQAMNMSIALTTCICCLTAMIRKNQLIGGDEKVPPQLAAYGHTLLSLYHDATYSITDPQNHDSLINRLTTLTDQIYNYGRSLVSNKLKGYKNGVLPKYCFRYQNTGLTDNHLNLAEAPLTQWLNQNVQPNEAMEPVIAIMCDYISQQSNKPKQKLSEGQYRDMILGIQRVIAMLHQARQQISTFDLGQSTYAQQQAARNRLEMRWSKFESRVLNSLTKSITRITSKLDENKKALSNEDYEDFPTYLFISDDVEVRLRQATEALVAEAYEWVEIKHSAKEGEPLNQELINLMDINDAQLGIQ